jgi:hypothetical protein
VVIGDLDLEGVATGPSEANSPLIVDPDAVLTFSAAPQPLQSVSRGYLEVVYALCRVHEQELSVCPPLHFWWQSTRALPPKGPPRIPIGKAANHRVNSNV